MGGKRQPTDLVVLKGKAHMGKATVAERKAREPKRPAGRVQTRAPDWLPETLRGEFNALRGKLADLNIFDQVDRDTLARYLVAQRSYLEAAKLADAAIARKDSDGAREWSAVQDRYFKQARNCATDLGMTITSRCRLVIPEAKKPEENPFEVLMRERQNRA